MPFAVDERLISRLQLVGTAVVITVLVLGLGFFFSRQIADEYEANIKLLEVQEIQQHENLLVRQIETAKGFLSNMRTRTEEILMAEIREQVDEAHALAEAIYAQEVGKRPEAEIRRLIVEALRPLRFFGGKGYFFIDGMDGSCVLLPIAPAREGGSLMDNRDDTGHYIMRGLIEAALKPVGEGYSRYRWYAPGNSKVMADKIAYVRHFKPFNWLIGTGHYVADVEASLKQEALDRLRSFRFGKDGSGYIVVIDDEERILVSPSRPWNEGMKVSELPPDKQVAAKPIYEQGRKGDGFIRYDWARDGGEGAVSTKVTYVSRMADWGWTLSAGLFLDDIATATAERRQVMERSISAKRTLTLTALGIGLLVALTVGAWFSHLTARLVERYKQDLTSQSDELRKASRDLFLINTMVESSAEMVILADGGWTAIYANPFVYEQLGGSPETLVGRRLDEIAEAVAANPPDAEGGSSRFETTLRAADGRRVPVDVVARDVTHDGAPYHFVIARDITERRQWEADLGRKTAALEHSNAELEQFAYVASHDLREPLRMVASYLSLLERRYGEKLDKDGHDFLSFARDGAQRLDRLVLDLLEFSRIDRRGSPIKPMEAGPALELAVKNLSMAMADASATVALPPSMDGISILGDAGQIVRLFQNLIGNAIKYRAPDRPSVVEVTCHRVERGWEFNIADNGIGIEPQYFERIFGIFQRLHTREKYEGTGIGLAICKKIVERHGGTIGLESEPGRGTTFTVVLPAA
ncbi:hypothetical protein A6A04_10035 [Paramagnetospirillum marisnigri]|uniref:histidine kinase n=1 Tax=Paramagnetospirillum marisnigri TaxID=1285242 RepID=A0A178M653_9PROT|nr:cache domain-containing protein [Paramagnetospirillum marisnigri]OAN43025.1 hypothetical protein A6A04_10035 [Paramagnetospirillum marisnigri]